MQVESKTMSLLSIFFGPQGVEKFTLEDKRIVCNTATKEACFVLQNILFEQGIAKARMICDGKHHGFKRDNPYVKEFVQQIAALWKQKYNLA